MGLKQIIKERAPWLRRLYRRRKRHKIDISLDEIAYQVFDHIGVRRGDVLLVHTSVARMNLIDASPEDIIYMLQKGVGEDGAILMPCFVTSKHAKKSKPFKVKRSRGMNGLINEMFRRMPDVRRSMHPWKSIAVWGAGADELVSEHHLSEKAFDEHSPYYKAMLRGAKHVGIGASLDYISFAHVVDDTHSELHPPLYGDLMEKVCIDVDGNESVVKYRTCLDISRSHQGVHNILPHLDDSITYQYKYRGIDFCWVDTQKYYERAVELAKQGISIYGDYKLPQNKD